MTPYRELAQVDFYPEDNLEEIEPLKKLFGRVVRTKDGPGTTVETRIETRIYKDRYRSYPYHQICVAVRLFPMEPTGFGEIKWFPSDEIIYCPPDYNDKAVKYKDPLTFRVIIYIVAIKISQFVFDLLKVF